VGALSAVLGRSPSNRDKARIFQALRIAVNRELDVLSRALPDLRDVLLPEGTMVVIAYHSLEDRLVKEAFREWSSDCVCPPELPVCRCRGRALGETLTRKPVRPGEEESLRNPRSRSALLRAWRKAA
jgi:16S rRNA (cytosine1402-N4)-methyltransferase